MKKLIFVNPNKKDSYVTAILLKDGRAIAQHIQGKYFLRWDTPIDLNKGVEYAYNTKCPHTTLNELNKAGLIDKVVDCYDEYDINLGWIRSMTIRRAIKIAKDFKKHGFNVSSLAIMHNYEAWIRDMKSGYRDERNGYHLFSPCGCNPFSLRATTLNSNCEDWQTTYTC